MFSDISTASKCVQNTQAITSAVLEAKHFRTFKCCTTLECLGSKCYEDGCWVEKFSRLVVARCLTGRQDASPYGCFLPPDASSPNHWLSHGLLLLFKVKGCILSKPWPTCWKNYVCVCIYKGETLVPSILGNCTGVTIRQTTQLENKKDRFSAFPLDFWYTNKVADYFTSLLHAWLEF